MTTGDNKDFQDLTFYRFIIDSLPSAVLTVNADLEITGFNPWAEKVTGYTQEEALGRYCGTILQGGMCHAHCPLRTVLKGHRPVSLVETTIMNKWGETIPVRMNTAGLLDDHGHLIGGVESFQDISRLKSLEREKEHMMQADVTEAQLKAEILDILADVEKLNLVKRDSNGWSLTNEGGKICDEFLNRKLGKFEL